MKRKKCDELLNEFKLQKVEFKANKLKFVLNDNKDIYNITAPFEIDNEVVIAGRVEARDSEHSKIMFFKEIENEWRVIEGTPIFDLQDPFVTKINGELVLGGVEIYETGNEDMPICYRTVFLKGNSLKKLERFAVGPDRMKDIRLLELSNNKILVFTRPQGEIGNRGTIGYFIMRSLEELTIENIESAKLLDNMFYEEEWGGANELHLLEDGTIGVLSHIAKFDNEGNRHYYSSVFTFNHETSEYSKMKLIAIRDNFEEGAAKRPDLIDVIFSGGLIRKENGQAELYCGVSDAEAHKILIRDPFKF
ncbi:DUF1861 family protein [Clostridium sp. CM028]|uniref:DUF1861 family protein n=1 Tax=unclassified Clostridium TaxID=2614128 RepID=UPI001C6EF882|nr:MULTISPECIES: DUF1861 family protein [unclassified Clostridium]MBW9146187.1 DUF1861 family protein [Clostridium sp. CM027]MBW9149659.1 DUF1861 family protein [Clostridium sp. CM028]UVE39832.1 DUF1861 family protein [Clostridium sp. CM027]WLC60529.1 DUF1861 family protein [Clostridium sp. CM028]